MFAYCMNNPVNMSDSTGKWPEWVENTVKAASAVILVAAVVVMVVAVSYYTAGTGSSAAVYGASVFLSAALSGINGGVANDAKGNSYANGYLGGSHGGAVQALCSKKITGIIGGGVLGVGTGTAITDFLNNLDPYSKDSTFEEIASNAVISGAKALVTSSLTYFISAGSNSLVADNSLMPTYTYGFGEAIKAFFGWLDDAVIYIWG